MRIYWTCWQVLDAQHDPRAEETLKTAHSLLMGRAEKIEEEGWRKSFLEVEANRQMICAYEGMV